MGEIRRDQRRVLQEKRGLIASTCSLAIGDSSHLRQFEEEDAAELHTLIEANRELLARWLPWAQAQTREDTREFIELTRTQAAADGEEGTLRQAQRVGDRSVDLVVYSMLGGDRTS